MEALIHLSAAVPNAVWITLYGAMGAATLAIVWRSRDLQLLGIALFLGFVLSNCADWGLSGPERPPFYSVIEVMVGLMAYFSRVGGGSRALTWIVGIALISIASNVAYSLYSDPTRLQTNVWQIFTNMCYAAECFLASFAGLRERGLRFGGGAVRRGTPASPAAHLRAEP